MTKPIFDSSGIKGWTAAEGLVADDGAGSRLFLFVNEQTGTRPPRTYTVEAVGACYGFVYRGQATVHEEGKPTRVVNEGEWFQTSNGIKHLCVFSGVRVVVMQRVGYRGMSSVGGPIEALGRLRYIDGCSDTLLVPPMLKGEPCLNHLHFPPNIDQTAHTHPSTRFGVVVSGRGECETPEGVFPLLPGVVFHIPTGGVHKFRTSDPLSMDIIAFHPDSDFGPTNADHPMVNRTLVDGSKIDNSDPRHAADVISPWL